MTINVIAEFGQTMRGDVGLAVEMVHQFAEAGATHIKVQMLDPGKIATATARSYWQTGPSVAQRESFAANGVIPHSGWDRVRTACWDAHVGFVATPFDLDAVDALRGLAPDAVKVASGDITFVPLLHAIGEYHSGVPILLSTGASTRNEVWDAVDHLGRHSETVPFACSLEYPCPIEHANLGRIHAVRRESDAWSEHFVVPFGAVGYSDHTVEAFTSGLAVMAGATWLEKHVTPYPVKVVTEHGVPDDAMGLGTEAFGVYVECARRAEQFLGQGDIAPTDAERASRRGARRAARWANDWDGARRVRPEDVTYLRDDPDGDGRSIALVMRVLADGSAATRPHKAGDIVEDDDFR